MTVVPSVSLKYFHMHIYLGDGKMIVKFVDINETPIPKKIESKEGIKYTPKIIIVCK